MRYIIYIWEVSGEKLKTWNGKNNNNNNMDYMSCLLYVCELCQNGNNDN